MTAHQMLVRMAAGTASEAAMTSGRCSNDWKVATATNGDKTTAQPEAEHAERQRQTRDDRFHLRSRLDIGAGHGLHDHRGESQGEHLGLQGYDLVEDARQTDAGWP
jgi:hypothetical protein